jgi:hypothetical protein
VQAGHAQAALPAAQLGEPVAEVLEMRVGEVETDALHRRDLLARDRIERALQTRYVDGVAVIANERAALLQQVDLGRRQRRARDELRRQVGARLLECLRHGFWLPVRPASRDRVQAASIRARDRDRDRRPGDDASRSATDS